MSNQESTTKTISNWARTKNGRKMKQVVIHTATGKNKKGKQLFHSQTKHVPA